MNSEIEKLERRWQENPLGLTFAPLAEAYRKSGETAKALELLESGLTQHPNYVPAHIVRGRCHLDAHSSAEAEQAFRRVLELDPENAIALKGLADLAEQQGKVSEAIGRLEALLDVDRNNEEARAQLDRLREGALPAAPPGAEALEPREPAPGNSGEFQLSDDAVSLTPGAERIPEIVLHDFDSALPSAEAAQGWESLAPPDPLAARGAASLSEESDPVSAGEPLTETEAAGQKEEEADTELVVTETMAEIFLRQGHRELALAVYTQLAQRDPANEAVAAACARLLAELAPPPPEPAAAEAPPRFDAASTGGRSVAELFGTLLAAERPAAAPALHPPAFDPPRRPIGEPTRPAAESLSLGAVFGEEAVPTGPAGAPAEPVVSEPSFEQFFTPPEGNTAEVELPKPPDNAPPAMSAMASEDLEQFNAWLRGLKR